MYQMKKDVAYRRRHYFIKKGLQSKFIISFSLAVVAIFLFHWFLVYYLVDRGLAQELYRSHIKIKTTGEVIKPILLYLNIVTIPVITILAGIIGYFLTRKIEMPLVEFKEAISAIEKGNFSQRLPQETPVELSEVFSAMSDGLKKTFQSIETNIGVLEDEVEKIDGLVKGRRLVKSELIHAIQNISVGRKGIEKELSKFKV